MGDKPSTAKTPTQQGNPYNWEAEGIAGAGWWWYVAISQPCIVIRGHIKSCMVIHGCAWSCMVVSGHVWSSTVVHSNIWFYMVMCGCVWSWMMVSGRAWSYIALRGGEWSHTVIHSCGEIQSHISVSTTWSRTDCQGHEDATGSPAPGYNVTDDQT